MTSEQQQRSVERYINGEMSPSEEQQFFIEVAVNDELRRRLKANRIVDAALGKDREALPRDHSRLREHLMGLAAAGGLGATGANAADAASGSSAARGTDGTSAGATTASSASTGTAASGMLGAIASAKAVILSVLGAGLIVAAVFVIPKVLPDTPPVDSPPGVESAAQTPAPAEEPVEASEIPPGDSVATESDLPPATATPELPPEASVPEPPVEQNTPARSPEAADSAEASPPPAPQTETKTTSDGGPRIVPDHTSDTVYSDDSVRFKGTIVLPQR